MKLSLEIPTSLLEAVTPLTDMDFALAHRVLEDTAYARHYASRPHGRELILDNSMHELGYPLAYRQLWDAATIVRADYVVTPDRLGDPGFTLRQYLETGKMLRAGFKVAVVMAGETLEERMRFAALVRDADMLCMPYREPRLDWWNELFSGGREVLWNRVHLLGVSSLAELKEWFPIVDQHLLVRFSVDTSKPLKAGLVGRRIDDGASLRGIPVSSKELLGMTATPEQLALIKENIGHVRKVLRREA
jgi:hypothetical protein